RPQSFREIRVHHRIMAAVGSGPHQVARMRPRVAIEVRPSVKLYSADENGLDPDQSAASLFFRDQLARTRRLAARPGAPEMVLRAMLSRYARGPSRPVDERQRGQRDPRP